MSAFIHVGKLSVVVTGCCGNHGKGHLGPGWWIFSASLSCYQPIGLLFFCALEKKRWNAKSEQKKGRGGWVLFCRLDITSSLYYSTNLNPILKIFIFIVAVLPHQTVTGCFISVYPMVPQLPSHFPETMIGCYWAARMCHILSHYLPSAMGFCIDSNFYSFHC